MYGSIQKRSFLRRDSCSSNVDIPSQAPKNYGKYAYGEIIPGNKARKCIGPFPRDNENDDPCKHRQVHIGTKGAHEFYNMMWDPTIYRGKCFRTFKSAEWERCNRKQFDPCLVKKRKFQRYQHKMGGIIRPVLHEGAVKPELYNIGLQTEAFLEELSATPLTKDACSQIEKDVGKGLPRCPYIPIAIGKHQNTQTDCSITCSFEDSVQEILRYLPSKVIEQSLLETTEDFELELLRVEKRKYQQKRMEELIRIQRLIDAQRKVAEERARAFDQAVRDAEVEDEAEIRPKAILFASAGMASMVPLAFNALRVQGYMPSAGTEDIQKLLLPFIDKEVVSFLRQKQRAARNLLDDIIMTVVTDREAEIAKGMWDPQNLVHHYEDVGRPFSVANLRG